MALPVSRQNCAAAIIDVCGYDVSSAGAVSFILHNLLIVGLSDNCRCCCRRRDPNGNRATNNLVLVCVCVCAWQDLELDKLVVALI